MTHYTVDYNDSTRDRRAQDARAVADIRDWLGEERFNSISALLQTVSIDGVNFALGFAGVTGYPFHAFCRMYRLDDYRAWMASEPDPIMTDEEGFTI